MKPMTISLLVALTMLYIAVIRKIFPNKSMFIEAISNFSLMDFSAVFRGRVFEENIMEAFIGLALVVTVFFIGISYAIVVVIGII